MKHFLVAVVLSLVSASAAHANGVVQGQDIAAKLAAALGTKTLACASATDHVNVSVDAAGTLRMVADYAGSISGPLDTDDEGDGAECGGLSVRADGANLVLDDEFNDCERGNWGYRLTFAASDLTRGGLTAAGIATVGGDGGTDTPQALTCLLK